MTGRLVLAALIALALPAAAEPPPPASQDFSDTNLVVGVQDASAIGAPAKAHARTWAARTGGTVEVLTFPYADLFEALKAGIARDPARFDVIFYAPAWAGDLYPYLAPMPADLADDPALEDIHPVYRDRLMTWNGDLISVTVDGDLYSGYYRRDLFEDPAHRRAFKAAHGYDLAPPDTWDQYRDIAAFFTGRIGPDGRPLFGTAEPFARGTQQFWNVFSRAAAYTNPPDQTGGQFFDLETMDAEIGNPGWVQAVTDYRDILAFAPPDARSHGIVEARQAFIDGRTAMILDWGDTAQLAADEDISRIRDKVGYFVLPGATRVWDSRADAWRDLDRPHKVPFLAFGGWVASVPRTSQNPEAAWDFIRWYASPANSQKDVVTSGTGINPYRYSHFIDIDAWTEALSPAAAAGYLGVVQRSLDSPHAALDLRIPGFEDYAHALEDGLEKVLDAEAKPRAAMAEVARRWDAITDARGREKQREIYRASMGHGTQP